MAHSAKWQLNQLYSFVTHCIMYTHFLPGVNYIYFNFTFRLLCFDFLDLPTTQKPKQRNAYLHMYVCMYICIFARTRQVRALSHPQPPSVPPIYPTCIRYMSLRYMSLLKCHYQRKAELPLSKKTLVIENKRPARSELFTNNNGGEYLRKPIYSFVVNHKQVQVTL